MDLTDLYNNLKTESVPDMVSFCKELDNLIQEKKIEYQLEKKVAFVSSSTMNGIKESLRAQSSKHNILSEVYLSEYNQFAQEILDDTSDLYRFNPEVVFLHLDTRTLAGENFFFPNNPDLNISQWKNDTYSLVQTLITKLVDADIKVIFSLFEVPDIAPLGVLESSTYGLNRAIYEINLSLMELSNETENLFLFDYDKFLGKIGKKQTFDERLYYLADIRLKPNLLSSFAFELAVFLKALYITPKKCLVLDLDNTLWGGVIGEAGMDGINLGPDPMGRSFMEFQQYILSLHNRGVILALNSKNNIDDALNVIRNHPHMVLREENFAAMRINWEDKVKNLRSLASEINIGLDSMVFVDDDDYNREMVRNFLPEVVVVDLPKDFSKYVLTLDNLDCFSTLKVTHEDLQKGKMYSQEKQRKTLQESSTDLSEYLNLLEMEGEIKINDKDNVQRISQMTQKTNQFNMTTKRYLEEDILSFIVSDQYQVLTLSLSDKFGDYGTTGLAIIKFDGEWMIDSFLLSCRILGREAENALMSEVISLVRSKGGNHLFGSFIKTEKNIVAQDAFEKLGFTKNDNDELNWVFNLKEDLAFPNCIKKI
tara:strand:+ start:872 stop:2656 length:1785 start_codon:yes stop_codon:yes gene_type:complete